MKKVSLATLIFVFSLILTVTPVNAAVTPTPTAIPDAIEDTPFELCAQIPDANLKSKCETCAGTGETTAGLWTAVGCIPTRPKSIIQVVIKIGLSIGGGFSLLMILSSAFRLSVSQGDPKAVNEAKDQLSAALIGLLFIILSITILQFIGVSLFHIPGFGT